MDPIADPILSNKNKSEQLFAIVSGWSSLSFKLWMLEMLLVSIPKGDESFWLIF